MSEHNVSQSNSSVKVFSIEEKVEDICGLTAYTMIGRPDGDNRGDISEVAVIEILQNPALYGCDGQWVDIRNGCPWANGKANQNKKKISYTVKDGWFTFICRDPSHNHPQARQKTDKNGNEYWEYSLSLGLAKSRNKFPPFITGSHTEIANVLLRSVFRGAKWNGPDTIRVFDDNYGNSKRGIPQSKTAGKWLLYGKDKVQEAVRLLDGEWIEVGVDKNGKAKHRRMAVNSGTVRGVYDQIMGILAARQAQVSQDESGSPISPFQEQLRPHIPLIGSVFDLETCRVVHNSDSSIASYYARAEHTMPCTYWSPSIKDPERFLSLLRTAWGHQDDFQKRVDFFQEWVGVAISGEATKYEKHVLLKGVAAAGKSQVIQVVSSLFPSSAVCAVSPTDLDGFKLSPFINARLNAVAEVPDTGMANATVMKALQSGDPIQIDRKYRDPVVIKSQAAWLLGCNLSWRPSERHDSVFRRWVLLTFDRAVPEEERVPGLSKMIIENELQAIIAWAVKGYKRFRANGGFTKVPSSSSAISQWRDETDPTRLYLTDRLIADTDGKGLSGKDLYQDYKIWAEENGFKAVSSTRFGIDISTVYVKKRTKRGTVYMVKFVCDTDSNTVDVEV